jgi:flagellar hook-associated protein 1 FlgK
MGSILTSLLNSTGALATYTRVFNVIQNNISNANTPGYARQTQDIVALPFQPNGGPAGGVIPGPLLSSRDTFLEGAVQRAQQQFGDAQERSASLGAAEPLFGVNGSYAVPDSLNAFFGAFSQLAVNPSDPVLRQGVITQAGNVAQTFNQLSQGIGTALQSARQSTQDSVTKINTLAQKIAEVNKYTVANSGSGPDAGLEAQLYADLEDLSSTANVSVIKSSDGTFNLYLGSKTPLVVGTQSFAVTATTTNAGTKILDSTGADITTGVTGGALAAQIQLANTTLPGYATQLNALAAGFADSINSQLSQGLDKNGQTPAVNLFSYNTAADAAGTLGTTAITPDQIAAAAAGAPGSGANAQAIVQLANAPTIGGVSYTQAFGNLSGQVGRDVQTAKDDQSRYQDLLTQSQAQRAAASGVDLNQEAATLVQFQQSYQAVGKLVSVLDTLSQTVIGLIQ